MKPIILALISLVSVAIPGSFLLADGASVFPTDPPPAVERKAFSHKDHVDVRWMRDEQKRDCQLCHDYAKNVQPEQTCSICHEQTMAVSGTIAEEKRAIDSSRPAWASIASFQHNDHLGLKCGDCHLERDAGGNPLHRSVQANISIPKGLGFCVDCHDPNATSQKFAAGRRLATGSMQANANFQKGINAAPSMESMGSEPFLHADHMTAAELKSGDLQACNVCHAGMSAENAKPEIGEDLFRKSDCAACHKASATTGLDISIKVDDKVPSGSDYTFFHKDHVGAEPFRKMASFGSGQGCFKCHEYSAGASTKADEYPLKKGYEKFQTCVDCHAAANSVKPTIRRPIADHGEVDNCYGCHTVGLEQADLDMKTNRPTREAKRRYPTTWPFRVHAHPHVTGNADIKSKECAVCHVSERPELPSRIKNKPFLHGPHLSAPTADASSASCLECHALEPENSFMQSGKTKDGGHLNYATDSCLTCHKEVGASLIAPAGHTAVDGRIVLFDHADHMKKKPDGSYELDCSACHVHGQNAQGDLEFGYAKGVMDCSSCHDHGPEKYKVTGNVDQAYVETCMDCHVVGVPEAGAPLFLERHIVQGLSGRQWHPLPTEQGCAECHKNTDAEMIPRGQLDPFTKVYGDKRQRFHTVVPQAQPCYGCHWHDAGRWGTGMSTSNKKTLRQKHGGGTSPIK
jgi:hypothetical protein